jgi:N utilization substance protein A
MLEEAGYRRVDDLAREDPDRLAIRTGLGIKKARQIHESARHFLSDEWKVIEEARARHAASAEGAEAQPSE